jgi:hypothetical protein
MRDRVVTFVKFIIVNHVLFLQMSPPYPACKSALVVGSNPGVVICFCITTESVSSTDMSYIWCC